MKLAITKNYIEELSEEYCKKELTYVPGYGVNRLFFNFFAPEPRIIFCSDQEFIVLTLGKMSLKVKDVQTIPLTADTEISYKGGVMVNKLKINKNGQTIFKTLINKKIVGLGDTQKNVVNI